MALMFLSDENVFQDKQNSQNVHKSFVFAQLTSFLNRSKFNRIVAKYHGDSYLYGRTSSYSESYKDSKDGPKNCN